MKKMIFNSSPLESNLVYKVEKYLKTTFRHEAWFIKTVGNASQKSGIPDILCCVKGKFIGIELKREDGSGKASEQQIIECRKIERAGGYSIIGKDFNEIKNFIEAIVKNG